MRIKPYCISHCKGVICDLGCATATMPGPGPMMLGNYCLLCHTQRREGGWSGVWYSCAHQAVSERPSQILAWCRWRTTLRLEQWSGTLGSVSLSRARQAVQNQWQDFWHLPSEKVYRCFVMVRLGENMVFPILSESAFPAYYHMSPGTTFHFCFLRVIIVWIYFFNYLQENVCSLTKKTNK